MHICKASRINENHAMKKGQTSEGIPARKKKCARNQFPLKAHETTNSGVSTI